MIVGILPPSPRGLLIPFRYRGEAFISLLRVSDAARDLRLTLLVTHRLCCLILPGWERKRRGETVPHPRGEATWALRAGNFQTIESACRADCLLVSHRRIP